MQDIEDYISALTTKYPCIKSIWLYGSRANNCFNDRSDWDLFVFADNDILMFLKSDMSFYNESVDLCIVYNGDNWEKPYPDIKDGQETIKRSSLTEFEWEFKSDKEATYKEKKYEDSDNWYKSKGNFREKEVKSIKIWPMD